MNLREKFFTTLAPLYDEVASAQQASGCFRTEPMKYTIYGQYAGIYFAYLYTHEHPENRYFHDAETLRRAVSGWDYYAAQISAEGKARIITYDQFWYDAVDEWGCYYWMNTLELLKVHLDSETVERWNQWIDRIASRLAQNIEQAVADPKYLAELSKGCADNHTIWALLCLYRYAMLRNDEGLRASSRNHLEKVLEHQLPSGTWMEGGTLVVGYGEVTICAISLFELYDDNPRAGNAVRKNLDYRLETLYPNFRGNDCLEGRTNYSKGIVPYTALTFNRYPEGRDYLARWIDYLNSEQPAGRRLHEALQGLAVISDLATLLPETEEPEDLTIPSVPPVTFWPEIQSRIVRQDGWIVTMCCLAPPSRLNRWILERQNLVSVFHEESGLLVGGGHSIAQPEFSIFNFISKGTLHYLHHDGELTPDGMKLRYGGCCCQVEALIVGGSVRLRYRAENLGETDRVRVNVPLWTDEAGSVSIGGKNFSFGAGAFSADVAPGDILAWTAVQMTATARAQLRYPFSPFNPYKKSGTPNEFSNRQAVLTLELTSDSSDCEIVIQR
jgi:hypothetical protein